MFTQIATSVDTTCNQNSVEDTVYYILLLGITLYGIYGLWQYHLGFPNAGGMGAEPAYGVYERMLYLPYCQPPVSLE
jgi:hypothetical protein